MAGQICLQMDMDNFKIGDAARTDSSDKLCKLHQSCQFRSMAPPTRLHIPTEHQLSMCQANGVLHNVVKPSELYDGQFYNFTANENIIIDTSGNPYDL